MCYALRSLYNTAVSSGHPISYTSYQNPGQPFAIGSPLLSYLDVRLCSFLSRGLTLGEAQRLGPQQITEGSLLPVKDGSIDQAFHDQAEHIPIKELFVTNQAKGETLMELVDSSSEVTETEELVVEMVVRRKMTTDLFLPGRRSATQQEAPPPPAPYGRKRPRETTESSKRPSDMPSGPPPTLTTVPLVIREPSSDLRPTEMIGSNIPSFSAPPAPSWQNVFMLGDQSLLAISSI